MRIPIRAITARPPTTPPTMAPIGGLETVEGGPVGVMMELDVVLVAVDKVVELAEVEVVEIRAVVGLGVGVGIGVGDKLDVGV